MRVHLIKERTIDAYARSEGKSADVFYNWLDTVKQADWEKTNDIKYTFGTTDLLGKGSNRVCFDIGGNNYRMICKIAFGEKKCHMFVCWIGTHKEYDDICAKNEQYKVNLF